MRKVWKKEVEERYLNEKVIKHYSKQSKNTLKEITFLKLKQEHKKISEDLECY